MQLFYAENIESDYYILPEEESKHCVRVLRLAEGDSLYLTDGRGTLAQARIVDPHPKRCEVFIEQRTPAYGHRPYQLHLAVAPTKNNARMEWLIEKAVEIGIDRITLLVCQHSERTTVNIDRLEKIAISAMKQSLKAYLPLIETLSFNDFMQQAATFEGLRFIAHCEGNQRTPIQSLLTPQQHVMILIGPEGDFSEQEVQQALSQGFAAVTLGDSRLRTETAALYTVVAANLLSCHN